MNDDWRLDSCKKAIVAKLKTRVGIKQALPGAQFTDYLNCNGFQEITHRELRNLIRDLRREGVPVCSASGRGYYWPSCIEDVISSRQLLDDMANDLHYTGKQMYDGAVRLFGQQQRLGL